MSGSSINIPVQKPHYMAQRDFDQLKQKAVELEGVFLNTLLSQVSSSVDTEGPFGGGHAEETWRGMLATEHASEMARAGGIGLADSILRDLIVTQSSQNSNQYFQAPPAGAYKQ